MTLTRGSWFGAYEVSSLLGVGGMGEVYRARDAKLNRDVALKILPDVFERDADRRARFEREAQILASLSHPAIGAIYGLEDADLAGSGVAPSRHMRALVLELVEGPTLADEIARGALPVAQALDIARQMADALEAAHQHGIVHRDLKPANVKIRPDGLVKVLDFGLAKGLESPTAHPPSGGPQTLLSPALTEIGMLFGTAAYMSPEQARGRAADERSDIWSFGCVLYEMLTGKRAFEGEETSDVLAAILRAEPDWSALPPDTPASVQRLLRRCLAKDRTRRLRHVGDARLEIEDAGAAPPAPVEPSRIGRSGERLVWGAAVAVAALGALALARWLAPAQPPAPEMRVDVAAGDTPNPASFAISPDGRSIVFNAEGERGSQLWVRSLGSSTPRALAGTDDGQYPFWSPDGRSIGFFTGTALKRVDVDGGQPRTLATAITPRGGSWGADGTILYVPNDSGGVFRVAATGGAATRVTPVTTPSLATRHPQFLPDGRHFLFHVAREDDSAGVYVGDLQTGDVRQFLRSDTTAMYGSGYLWFFDGGTLLAQAFDLATHELTGQVLRVVESAAADQEIGTVSASVAGPVAFRAARGVRDLVWFDRAGRRLETIRSNGVALGNPELSPDGRRLLVQRTLRQNVDVWLVDLERNGLFTRLTVDPQIDSMPVWAPDGRRFAFNTGGRELEVVAPGGQGRSGMVGMRLLEGSASVEELAPFNGTIKIATDWSSDGQFVLIKQQDPTTGTWDVWAVPLEDRTNPLRLTSTAYDERDAQFAPDGRSVAYESNESGAWEIYAQSFPEPDTKVPVSTNGGRQVRWRRDGAELFYVALDGTLMAVPVEHDAVGGVTFGTPAPLFPIQLVSRLAIGRQQYVVSADGQRFLVVTDEDDPAPITLLLNWKPPAAP